MLFAANIRDKATVTKCKIPVTDVIVGTDDDGRPEAAIEAKRYGP